MLARHLWMQKIWDNEYADYEKYAEAFKKAVIEALNTQPASTYKDRPIHEALTYWNVNFAEWVLFLLRKDELFSDYNYMSTGLLTRNLEEACRRTDKENRLYAVHVQTAQHSHVSISDAVRAYIDEWAEELTKHYYFIAANGACYTPDKYMSGYCTGYPHAGKLWGVAAILTGKCVKQINRHN